MAQGYLRHPAWATVLIRLMTLALKPNLCWYGFNLQVWGAQGPG